MLTKTEVDTFCAETETPKRNKNAKRKRFFIWVYLIFKYTKKVQKPFGF